MRYNSHSDRPLSHSLIQHYFLSVCLSICLSVCPSFRLSTSLSVCYCPNMCCICGFSSRDTGADENKGSSDSHSHSIRDGGPLPHPPLSTSVSDIMTLRPSSDLQLFYHRPPPPFSFASSVVPLATPPPTMAAPSPTQQTSSGAKSSNRIVYGCPSCERHSFRGPSPYYIGHSLQPTTVEPSAPPPPPSLQVLSNDDLLLLHHQYPPHSHCHAKQQHPLPQQHLCPCSNASRCLFISYSMQEGFEPAPKCLLHEVPRGAVDSDLLRPTTLILQQLYSSCSCSMSPPPPFPPIPNDWKYVHVASDKMSNATAPPPPPPLFSTATPHPTNPIQMQSTRAPCAGQPPGDASAAAVSSSPATQPSVNSRPATSVESTAATSGSLQPTPPRDLRLTLNEEETTDRGTEMHTDTSTEGQRHSDTMIEGQTPLALELTKDMT